MPPEEALDIIPAALRWPGLRDQIPESQTLFEPGASLLPLPSFDFTYRRYFIFALSKLQDHLDDCGLGRPS